MLFFSKAFLEKKLNQKFLFLEHFEPYSHFWADDKIAFKVLDTTCLRDDQEGKKAEVVGAHFGAFNTEFMEEYIKYKGGL